MYLRHIILRKRNTIILFMLASALIAASFWHFSTTSKLFGVKKLESFHLSATQHPCIRAASTQELHSESYQLEMKSCFDKSNAVEEAKLKLYMFVAKEKLGIKGVITILANKPRINALLESINLLYKSFNHHFGYPLVIFHEADFLPNVEEVRKIGFNTQKQMSSIFFQQIDLSAPDWHIKKFGKPPKDVCGDSKSIGYRSMCRFQAKLVYEQEILRHFDYHWRLDDDSHMTANMSFDVFAFLKNGGFSYGYFQSMVDECAHDTYNITVDFMMSRNIAPTFFHKLKRNEIFFNNFEVSNMKLWRSKQYRDYIEYVDSLGGFYTHRWGDAPIKTLALSMFTPLSEIYRFRNVSYYHHSLNSPFKTIFQP